MERCVIKRDEVRLNNRNRMGDEREQGGLMYAFFFIYLRPNNFKTDRDYLAMNKCDGARWSESKEE